MVINQALIVIAGNEKLAGSLCSAFAPGPLGAMLAAVPAGFYWATEALLVYREALL